MNWGQKKDGWCGPAALSYTMHLQGKEVSQEELAKKLEATISEGTDNEDMVRVAKSYGFDVKTIEGKPPETTLSLLEGYRRQGKFPILDYLMGSDLKNDGHYSVYMGKTADTVKLFNVSPGKVEVRDKNNFILKWKDIGTDNKKVYNRWAMILL